MKLLIHRVRPGARLPTRASEAAAGLDLYACMSDEPNNWRDVAFGDPITVGTGIVIELPPTWTHEAQVRPRSGLARKHGVAAIVGTIDPDYRGEIMVTLVNHCHAAYRVAHGDRIAQLVISTMEARVQMVEVGTLAEMSETARGAKGFGSSGT